MLGPLLALGLLLASGAASSVAAHGEETLELGADRVQPGGSVEVRGDLGAGERFEVALISQADGSRRTLATIQAIEEGHFDTYVTIPPDAPSGAYLVEVTAQDVADATTARVPFAIAGSRLGPDGDRPDQAEGLPGSRASGPTVDEPSAGGVRPARSATVPEATEPRAAGQPLLGLTLVGGVLVFLAVVVLAGALFRRLRAVRS
jgi:hypothetical protein